VDWLDPDTWKLPASLIDYWKTILGGAVVIIGALASFVRWGLKPVGWARSKVAARTTITPPTADRRLRFVQNERDSFWGPCGRGDEPGTQVAGRWHVTNTSDQNIFLLRARLDGHARPADLVVVEGPGGMHSSRNPVPAQRMVGMSAHFMLFPPIISGTEPLVADVIFTDNLEQEHRVRAVFRFVRAPR
jgi:hypothetical protein